MLSTTLLNEPATGAGTIELLRAGEAGYDEARSAWNLAADQRPAAVVVARSAEDVRDAVLAARDLGLRVVPQGTGHLASALPPMEDALLLRTAIGGVTVAAVASRARVGAGTVWQEVVDAVTPHGLAALSGSSHDVGVVGYTLGGGMSWMARRHGLACNTVYAIEVVTPDGRLRRATAEQDAELFWALRGGGGNFGIVTALEIELFAVREVYAGMTVWPAAQAREVLEAWVAWSRTAPESATTALRLLRLPPDPMLPEPLRDTPVVVVDGAVLDIERAAAATLAPFREVGTPVMDTWAAMSPAGLLQIHMDPPAPVPALGDTTQLADVDDAAIDALLAVVRPEEVAPLLFAELRQMGGALSRVPEGAGARGAMDGAFTLFAVGVPQGPESLAALDARLTELLGAMRPWSTGTQYVNFAERGGDLAAGFDATAAERLQRLRGRIDPDELLVASHRIAPR
jgi:FAD/FMN-containing dehydrogenase